MEKVVTYDLRCMKKNVSTGEIFQSLSTKTKTKTHYSLKSIRPMVLNLKKNKNKKNAAFSAMLAHL